MSNATLFSKQRIFAVVDFLANYVSKTQQESQVVALALEGR
jgi:hypothetical protein